ncbi:MULTISPECIES: RNA 2'-phosphotransferase [unclassified Rathayibacter]|uniref:RNA 2'-phosphotransferase n=1 Tax=unclassified Rathayibacter TaxID=2609250 RepID=UPI0010514865|nr:MULTISPECIES: RNA 2'-phosphotransferase [unclassified Rathayibacter]TCL80353.1 RNA:NAD 2'-phosphotransferase (TPT1/KptA family) [Rathayibacter sp. PhB192]TCM25879.1 RNA:NAD 2'-phosphotransferase (TPT1/KptA family) [Rathayibacter sp. PhB179]
MTPSPFDVASRIEQSQNRRLDRSLEVAFEKNFPEIKRLAERLGVDVVSSIREWATTSSSDAVADWLDVTITGHKLASLVKDLQAQDPPIPLLGRLVHEEHLSRRIGAMAPYMRSLSLSTSSILNKTRERTALAAFDAAFDATSQRRTLFARVLTFARMYLEYVVSYDQMNGLETNRSFSSRLGMTGILAARFSTPSRNDLIQSCEALLDAHEKGSKHALAYFVEGCTWIYDFYGDADWLHRAADEIKSRDTTEVAFLPEKAATSWYLNVADVWLRLSQETRSMEGASACIENARAAVRLAKRLESPRPEDRLRATMLESLLEGLVGESSLRNSSTDVRLVRFPFSVRGRYGRLPGALYRHGIPVVDAVLASSEGSSFVGRDICAELLSSVANDSRTTASSTKALLQRANRLREGEGRQVALMGSRVKLSLAEDQLVLASLEENWHRTSRLRREAISYLALKTADVGDAATKLTVLAQEIEKNGALTGALLDGETELAIAVRNGDFVSLYEIAARSAILSHDLKRVALGGRSGGVASLMDSDRADGRIFVFKIMNEIAHERDATRTERLADWIEKCDVSNDFAVTETVTTLDATTARMSEVAEGQVVSVRRYRNGLTLSAQLEIEERQGKIDLLTKTSRFLAYIHAMPSSRSITGVRKTLWAKEFGWWLRRLVGEDVRAVFFERWWSELAQYPCFERRDAHSQNWLVEADGRIVAVDLEASGFRPLGYELAQLIEDHRVFEPDDWQSRKQIVSEYISQLRDVNSSLTVELDSAFVAYELAAIARFVRLIFSSDTNVKTKDWAGRCLDSLSRSGDSTVAELAAILSRAWAEMTGVASGRSNSVLDVADRRRISRAMSYRLRHDPLAPLSREGWIHVDDLTDLLRADGHSVSSRQLMQIAGALGESRFELDDLDIRASYGHSVSSKIVYERRTPSGKLFHATPVDNIASIFEAESGLTKGRRQYVHLTDSRLVAMRASRRQGKPVVLLEIDTEDILGLVYAAANTWLAEWVSVDQMRIATIHSEREFGE